MNLAEVMALRGMGFFCSVGLGLGLRKQSAGGKMQFLHVNRIRNDPIIVVIEDFVGQASAKKIQYPDNPVVLPFLFLQAFNGSISFSRHVID